MPRCPACQSSRVYRKVVAWARFEGASRVEVEHQDLEDAEILDEAICAECEHQFTSGEPESEDPDSRVYAAGYAHAAGYHD